MIFRANRRMHSYSRKLKWLDKQRLDLFLQFRQLPPFVQKTFVGFIILMGIASFVWLSIPSLEQPNNETAAVKQIECDFVNTFNNIPNELQISMQSNEFMYEAMPAFLEYFESELICEPSIEFNPQPPPFVELNCSDSRYKLALNGEKRTDNIHIVDLIIFGFDVHYLEIRLFEYYDVIDAFFIIEQDHSLKGYKKPFLLPQVLNTSRFLRFADKIHYIQDPIEDEVIKEAREYQKFGIAYYPTEQRGRIKVRRYFQNYYATQEANVEWDHVYIIQGDGDELINRHVLYHLKHCQDREVYPLHVPSILYKSNIDIQVHGHCGNFSNISQKYEEIIFQFWLWGPSIFRADFVNFSALQFNSTEENRQRSMRFLAQEQVPNQKYDYHFGYGAGMNFGHD